MVNDLVHTRLDIRFDYAKAHGLGKVWITLKPHFYPTDSLKLDAKGMDIKEVALVNGTTKTPLKYTYDSSYLYITLNKTYRKEEKYTVYIDYVSKPNDLKVQGSAAINDAKGLYFINPTGTDKDKPTQIWTQGETEATSAWCPTIDKPNQKTTDEMYITVPAKYVTLSNGKLVSQAKNTDGTRTDYWKMDLPHAPYLFFIGVGDYAIVKDSYKGMEVNYYVEKEYEKVARRIFGYTPEMIATFEKWTGTPYAWVKYAQIVGRDYVSGAMENTTATLHQESAQQNARELVDGNKWEDVIAHELFHQWFGDLVTTESWSNLTVNESFANYSEILWLEHKYGKDAADEHNYTDMQGYLMSGSGAKDLVRFYYKDKEDMFDAVSYNKGGRILHMLRNYVGDSAFSASLKLYLAQNKFSTGEAHQLRLAFEKVTGKDLNWFFNQWYFGSGNPKLDISYQYDAASQTATAIVAQTQKGDKLFTAPIFIDVYNGSNKTRHQVWLKNKVDTFTFKAATKPDLINVDGDKILLCSKTDKHTLPEYVHLYKYAGKYLDRREALDFAVKNKKEAAAKALLISALNDPFKGLRRTALRSLEADDLKDAGTLAVVEKMAKTDADRTTRAQAIGLLGKLNNKAYESLFTTGAKDSSYSVAGASLEALSAISEEKALALMPELSKDQKGDLKEAIEGMEILKKTDADFDSLYAHYMELGLQQKFQFSQLFINYLSKVNNTANFKKGVDAVIAFRNQVLVYGEGIKAYFDNALKGLQEKKKAAKGKGIDAAALNEQLSYLEQQLK